MGTGPLPRRDSRQRLGRGQLQATGGKCWSGQLEARGVTGDTVPTAAASRNQERRPLLGSRAGDLSAKMCVQKAARRATGSQVATQPQLPRTELGGSTWETPLPQRGTSHPPPAPWLHGGGLERDVAALTRCPGSAHSGALHSPQACALLHSRRRERCGKWVASLLPGRKAAVPAPR